MEVISWLWGAAKSLAFWIQIDHLMPVGTPSSKRLSFFGVGGIGAFVTEMFIASPMSKAAGIFSRAIIFSGTSHPLSHLPTYLYTCPRRNVLQLIMTGILLSNSLKPKLNATFLRA
jgi:hypothetical protein